MRTIVVLCLLVAIFVSTALYGQHYLATTGKQMIEAVEGVSSALRAQQWDNAQAASIELQKRWQTAEKRWNLLTEHQEIDDINGSLSRLKAFVQEQDVTGALAEAEVVVQLFTHIPEKERLTLANIF